VLAPPAPIKTALEFSKFMLACDIEETNQALAEPIRHLKQRLVGFVTTTYDHLLACFGLPNELFADVTKIACEWRILFEDGTPAWVYSMAEAGY
jgi:hypothetical protein